MGARITADVAHCVVMLAYLPYLPCLPRRVLPVVSLESTGIVRTSIPEKDIVDLLCYNIHIPWGE